MPVATVRATVKTLKRAMHRQLTRTTAGHSPTIDKTLVTRGAVWDLSIGICK